MANEAPFTDLFIVPIDFSKASLNATFYALELAAKFKTKLKLIHAYAAPEARPMSFDDTDFYAGTLATHIADIRDEADKSFAHFLETIRQYILSKSLPDTPIETSLVNGLPDEITLYTAESEKAGLIILGISGKEVRTFEPMGKLASRIIEKSTIPVLVVPEEAEFTGIGTIRNVLYATAFDESDFSAIGKLISIVKNLDVNIFCVHIDNEQDNGWNKVKMDGLREYFNKAYGKTNVESDLIISKDIIKALDEFIALKKIDILSITSHKRNIISKIISPSITMKILYHTRVPLLVFHG